MDGKESGIPSGFCFLARMKCLMTNYYTGQTLLWC
jgi:hypothetical protein